MDVAIDIVSCCHAQRVAVGNQCTHVTLVTYDVCARVGVQGVN